MKRENEGKETICSQEEYKMYSWTPSYLGLKKQIMELLSNNEKENKFGKKEKTWERDAHLNITLGSEASLAKFGYSTWNFIDIKVSFFIV